jgi:hypothetical protein
VAAQPSAHRQAADSPPGKRRPQSTHQTARLRAGGALRSFLRGRERLLPAAHPGPLLAATWPDPLPTRPGPRQTLERVRLLARRRGVGPPGPRWPPGSGRVYRSGGNASLVRAAPPEHPGLPDNGPCHRGKLVKARRAAWRARGLRLFFLPPYCPHLNRIETLWRQWSNTTGSRRRLTPALPPCASVSPPSSTPSASTTAFLSRRCLARGGLGQNKRIRREASSFS